MIVKKTSLELFHILVALLLLLTAVKGQPDEDVPAKTSTTTSSSIDINENVTSPVANPVTVVVEPTASAIANLDPPPTTTVTLPQNYTTEELYTNGTNVSQAEQTTTGEAPTNVSTLSRSNEGTSIPMTPFNGSATPSPGDRTDNGTWTNMNDTTEVDGLNNTSPSASVTGHPEGNETAETATTRPPNEPGNNSSGSPNGNATIPGNDGITDGMTHGTSQVAQDNNVNVTTQHPGMSNRTETVTKATNATSLPIDHATPKHYPADIGVKEMWKYCSTECRAIIIGVPVAAIVICLIILIVSLLCIKQSRNFSLSKSSRFTELRSINGPRQYNRGEPPDVTTEVSPESFTNWALID